MSSPTLEQKVRWQAGLHGARVIITKHTRSTRRFVIHHEPDSQGNTKTHVNSKKGALQVVLAKVRCLPTPVFKIERQKP